MNPSPPVLVVGTGAMACLIAARLVASGQKVNMFGSWQAGLDALNQRGLRVLGPDGIEHAYPVFATSDPLNCRGTRFAIVLVKTYQTRIAALKLRSCLADDGLALTLQNGLGNLEILSEALGKECAAAGTTPFGATQLQPGFVRPFDQGIIILGKHARLDPLTETFRSAGFSIDVRYQIDTPIWSKLVINCAANPLSVILELTNGEILSDPYAHQMALLLAREAAHVAAALNIQLAYADVDAQVEKVLQATAPNRTSMYQDFQRGSPECEIDAINGAVVEAARRTGVPTPYNEAITLMVKARFAARKPVELMAQNHQRIL